METGVMSQAQAEDEGSGVPPEVYSQLDAAPPASRAEIVLRLVEGHPERRLVLPARDGLRPNLDGIVLGRPAIGPGAGQAPHLPSWWIDERSGFRLRGADLRGVSLRGADLRGVDLGEADLRDTDLGRADLRGGSLRLANLRGSRLDLADLRGVDLAGADLQGALLEGADLRSADLANVELGGAGLGEVDLRGAMLEEANLRGGSVRFARLQGAVLEGADLRDTDLWGCDLEGADLTGADLRDARLEEVRLRNAVLVGANLQGCILRKADAEGADLTGADLRGAILSGAILRHAVLREAKLQEVSLADCDITHVHLGGAKLDDTPMQLKQLGGAIGEELARAFEPAVQGYLALERNFEGLGDHDAASWAYRRRRRMQKREALGRARKARAERRWRRAVGAYAKFSSDQFVEWMCDYGESIPRVLGSLIAVYLVFTLLYLLTGSVVREVEVPGGIVRVPTRDPAEVAIFSLLAMTTSSPQLGLLPRGKVALLLTGVHVFLGIALIGLLGFVLGNRIRR
jgi:uncharacterized protein YjbI with pentapeptide repeats